MGRLVFWLLIGVLLWWAVRGILRSLAAKDSASVAPPQTARGEDMVSCARCGVNVPRSSAREEDGKFYCIDNPNCRPAP